MRSSFYGSSHTMSCTRISPDEGWTLVVVMWSRTSWWAQWKDQRTRLLMKTGGEEGWIDVTVKWLLTTAEKGFKIWKQGDDLVSEVVAKYDGLRDWTFAKLHHAHTFTGLGLNRVYNTINTRLKGNKIFYCQRLKIQLPWLWLDSVDLTQMVKNINKVQRKKKKARIKKTT